MDGSEQDRVDERDELLVKEDPFEKDRGDILIEGERAGVSSDGEGEAERVGEQLTDGSFTGMDSGMMNAEEGIRETVKGRLNQKYIVGRRPVCRLMSE